MAGEQGRQHQQGPQPDDDAGDGSQELDKGRCRRRHLARDQLGQGDGCPDTDGGSEQHGDARRQRRAHDQDASAVLTGGRRPGSRPDKAQPDNGRTLERTRWRC